MLISAKQTVCSRPFYGSAFDYISSSEAIPKPLVKNKNELIKRLKKWGW
jgi:hypothetical protein